MDRSENLDLPYIAPSQAQKHVTHNDAIRTLDAVVQLALVDRTRTVPPEVPIPGDRHLVAPPATGAWAGKEGEIAAWQDDHWRFVTPKPGWIAWIVAEEQALVHDGENWRELASVPEILPHLGLNTSADAVNRLAVRADASLFDQENGGHRIKINKASAADTASLLFQTGYSGRAEFGTPGDDRFRIKVSADGGTWHQSMVFDPQTGNVGVATDAPTTELHVNGALRVQSYAVASLPSPSAAGSGAVLHVYDEAGGSVLAFSDGGSWRRVTDRAVVS